MCDRYLGKDEMNHLREIGFRLHSDTYVYRVSDTTPYCGISSEIVTIDGCVNQYLEKEESLTVDDIIELLPDMIDGKYNLVFTKKKLNGHMYYRFDYKDVSGYSQVSFMTECLIDSAYKMLCWCIVNDYIDEEKE